MNFRISGIFLFLLLFFSCSRLAVIPSPEYTWSFKSYQRQLIMEGDKNLPMRILTISDYRDSLLLRTSCEPIDVANSTKLLKHFSSRMLATVLDSNNMGVGIAAPQVGISKRMIMVQRFDKKNLPFEVYINPRIKKFSEKKQACKEGCLSIPGRADTTQTRAYAILLEYENMDASYHYEMVEGFTAVIFQHEIDHLNGILYLDHLAEETKAAQKP